VDTKQKISERLRELSLFTGAGGGVLGGQLFGCRTICACEINPYASSVLVTRQNDGILPVFPIWDDICTFNGRDWRGCIDIVSGGFPCQDISGANHIGKGIEGERSGLWSEMARIIKEVHPSFAFIENSPNLRGKGLNKVLFDLASCGYDAIWENFTAAEVGAPHIRNRIWILAYPNLHRRNSPVWLQALDIALRNQPTLSTAECYSVRSKQKQKATKKKTSAWKIKPGVPGMADGMALQVEQIRALGNGQVPRVAAFAWSSLLNKVKASIGI
jgi:DNA (cytosine-5)-methyltransferase 1